MSFKHYDSKICEVCEGTLTVIDAGELGYCKREIKNGLFYKENELSYNVCHNPIRQKIL